MYIKGNKYIHRITTISDDICYMIAVLELDNGEWKTVRKNKLIDVETLLCWLSDDYLIEDRYDL